MVGSEERGPQRDDESEGEAGVEALGEEIVRLAAWLQAKEAELAALRARRAELAKLEEDARR